MILLDAIYINNGGGRVLLNYLVETIEKSDLDVFYLLDNRIDENDFSLIKDKSKYLKASIICRQIFYITNKNRFSKVFCFGNIPPLIKLSVPVYTYFHQKLFLKIPRELPFKEKVLFSMKKFYFKKTINKSDFWIVQSQLMKRELVSQYEMLTDENVLIIPFYPIIASQNEYERIKGNFLYVSGGAPHKNHLNLIHAFVNFYDKYNSGKLILTVSSEFNNLHSLLKELSIKGYPIENKGFLTSNELVKLYQQSEYFIYPSLSESFGLGLVEALENGCKIIGANLEYTFEICNPSIIFDPLDVKSIENAFENAIKNNIKMSEQLVFNEVDKLINIFKN
jgi:glycosyltransferase involved in cell wall biosynthesis